MSSQLILAEQNPNTRSLRVERLDADDDETTLADSRPHALHLLARGRARPRSAVRARRRRHGRRTVLLRGARQTDPRAPAPQARGIGYRLCHSGVRR
jgi:hypothetical protein